MTRPVFCSVWLPEYRCYAVFWSKHTLSWFPTQGQSHGLYTDHKDILPALPETALLLGYSRLPHGVIAQGNVNDANNSPHVCDESSSRLLWLGASLLIASFRGYNEDEIERRVKRRIQKEKRRQPR